MITECCEKKISGDTSNLNGTIQIGDSSTDASRLLLPSGSSSAPSLAYIADPTTGLKYINNSIVAMANGTIALQVGSGATTSTTKFTTGDGALTAPAYSFISNTNNGMWNAGVGGIGFSSVGVKTLELAPTYTTIPQPIREDDGLVGTPSYSFTQDTNTGLYRIGGDNIGVSCNGVKQVDISTTSATFTNPVVFTNTTLSTTANTSGAIITSYTFYYKNIGGVINVLLPDIGYGNGTAAPWVLGTLPVGYRPSALLYVMCRIQTNTTPASGMITISSAGVITAYKDMAGNGFMAAGANNFYATPLSFLL